MKNYYSTPRPSRHYSEDFDKPTKMPLWAKAIIKTTTTLGLLAFLLYAMGFFK